MNLAIAIGCIVGVTGAVLFVAALCAAAGNDHEDH